ncbi:MAG: hypothetical protein M0P47_12660 [Bacteroidales bacterium]|nr:hypothetical protein [Bacteroidales bacterium]
MKEIKIKKWSELNGKRNGNCELFYSGHCNAIFIKEDEYDTVRLKLDRVTKDEANILCILRLYGFNVEFEKPQITMWEKAKKENWSKDFIIKQYKEYAYFTGTLRMMSFEEWLFELNIDE